MGKHLFNAYFGVFSSLFGLYNISGCFKADFKGDNGDDGIYT